MNFIDGCACFACWVVEIPFSPFAGFVFTDANEYIVHVRMRSTLAQIRCNMVFLLALLIDVSELLEIHTDAEQYSVAGKLPWVRLAC
jgi:hypothetical protein